MVRGGKIKHNSIIILTFICRSDAVPAEITIDVFLEPDKMTMFI